MADFIFKESTVIQPPSRKFIKEWTLTNIFQSSGHAHVSQNSFFGTKAATEKRSLVIAVPEL